MFELVATVLDGLRCAPSVFLLPAPFLFCESLLPPDLGLSFGLPQLLGHGRSRVLDGFDDLGNVRGQASRLGLLERRRPRDAAVRCIDEQPQATRWQISVRRPGVIDVAPGCFGRHVVRLPDVLAVHVPHGDRFGHLDDGQSECERVDVGNRRAVWRPETVVSVGIVPGVLLRRLLLLLDALAPKLGVWRRDDHPVPGRLQGIEQVVCEAKRLVEPRAGNGDVDQKLLVRLQVLSVVDLAARQEVLPRATDQAVGAGHGPGKSWNAGAGCWAGLRHGRSRERVGPGPHDGIAWQRLRKRRPLRRLAHRQLCPVAALRPGHPQLGTHPGEVASGHLELLGDLDHWRRPNQLVELFPRDHVRSHRHRSPFDEGNDTSDVSALVAVVDDEPSRVSR